MTKKVLKGTVIRDKNSKTIVVLVKRKYAHPFFKKVITSSKKYHAHDETNKFKTGDNVEIILAQTPFYPEMGGQLGDTGLIKNQNGELQVLDTQSPLAGLIVNRCKILSGTFRPGDPVTAVVENNSRSDTARNHTATHLLHSALRSVLGNHVRQHGSLVAPDRLRFDFTHVSSITDSELREVQTLVNRKFYKTIFHH